MAFKFLKMTNNTLSIHPKIYFSGHLLCQNCHQSQLRHNEESCPSCRSDKLDIKPIIPPLLVMTQFIGNSVECRNSNCTYRGSAVSILLHTSLCQWSRTMPETSYTFDVFQCPELIVKVISCIVCRQVPIVNTCIYQCQNAHLYCSTCVNLGSRYTQCYILGCNSPTKYTSLSTMQFLHMLIQVPNFRCHFNSCPYESEFFSTLLHIRSCPNADKGATHSGCTEKDE